MLRETKLIASGSRSQPSSYQQTSDGSNLLRSTGGSWTQNWDGWQGLVGTAQAMGKDFVGITYGASGDTHAMTFGKASFLLDWKGGGGAFIYETVDGSDPANNAWHDEHRAAARGGACSHVGEEDEAARGDEEKGHACEKAGPGWAEKPMVSAPHRQKAYAVEASVSSGELRTDARSTRGIRRT